MIPKRVLEILETAVGETPQLLPTIIFNEGWMLRLVLDRLSKCSLGEHPLSFSAGAKWFSEALLPSPFLARTRADKLAESFTHADAVIGHINVSLRENAMVKLQPDAIQFVVTEAKMSSALSPGVKNAPFYNQAARNVACIAKVLEGAARAPEHFHRIGFYVLAPQAAIDEGRFAPEMQRDHIETIVRERVRQYNGSHDVWLEQSFLPLLSRIELNCISWESILSFLESTGDAGASELRTFYENCKKYNLAREPTIR